MAIDLNAATNGVTISRFCGDPTVGSPPDVDVVLVGDLFYEAELAERVTRFLDRCIRSNIDVLVGDPGRRFLPRGRLRLLAQYPGLDFGNCGPGERAENGVFSFAAEATCGETESVICASAPNRGVGRPV